MTAKTVKQPEDHKKKQKRIINEDAVNQLAAMIGPAMTIFTDEEIKNAFADKTKTYADLIAAMMQKYPTEIVKLLAAHNGIAYGDAEFTAKDILVQTLSIFSDPDLLGFFGSLLRQG